MYKKLRKHSYIIILLLLPLCMSCLHSKTGAYSAPKNVKLKINYGNAIIKIHGQINEDLYYDSIFENNRIDYVEYNNRLPVIAKNTVTINEEKYLSTGEEYSFSLQPTEVVTINIRSLDNNDVEIIIYESGKEKIYVIKGNDNLGKMIAFQNR
ncbi:hypothetical protein FACS189483_11180 [Spirochaetia bacterium]|nr:hypothetical protein FACS189483_11180 [Spirochaetia bacterium]